MLTTIPSLGGAVLQVGEECWLHCIWVSGDLADGDLAD
jgi:hypothetical protein